MIKNDYRGNLEKKDIYKKIITEAGMEAGMWNRIGNKLRMLFLWLCALFLFRGWTVSAAVAESAENYEMGEEFEGGMEYGGEVRMFRFALSEKSHVTLYLTCNGRSCTGAIYNLAGQEVLRKEDLEFKANFFTGWSSAELSRTLASGTYYLEIENKGKWKWQKCRFSFRVQAERQIRLEKGVLESLESKASGQLAVSCRPVEEAIGYRIQYTQDEQFQKGVKMVYAQSPVEIIKDLAKGVRYYVKICPYTVYDDGTYVYGQNSFVKTEITKP